MSFEVLKDYFREIRKIPVLSADEELTLVKRAQKGDEESRVKLIRSNLRLVIKIARRYERLGLSISDLIEEGNIGLMKALNRFNHRLGYRFSTYASWWIRQHIIRAIANQSRVVRIPVYMSELLHKMRKAQERLMHKYGRKPSNTELARALGITVHKVQELQRVSKRASSLDRRISEDGEMEFIDLLQDDEIEAVDELVNLFNREEIEAILFMMADREKEIIELRFGLKTGLPKTLAEVARKFGITRERVRQIEKEALEKMRDLITSGKLTLRRIKNEREEEQVKMKKLEVKSKKLKSRKRKVKSKKAKSKAKKKQLKTQNVKSKIKNAKSKQGKAESKTKQSKIKSEKLATKKAKKKQLKSKKVASKKSKTKNRKGKK